MFLPQIIIAEFSKPLKNTFMSSFTRAAFLCAFVFALWGPWATAQTYTPDSDITINTCAGTFQDSGGPNSDYSPGESYEVTICPDGSGGSHIKMVFSDYDFGETGSFCYYDGADSGAPLMGCAETFMESSFIVQATADNPSGCLTFVFEAGSGPTGEGWVGNISCQQACQNIFVELDGTNFPISPPDTGYIDICPGDRVAFQGRGVYPQNNTAYTQSDLTSTFEWDFGDGITAVGQNVSHIYDEPGGYNVQLTITDTEGCTNINFLDQRVRVSTKPDFTLLNTLPDRICVGDTLDLSASLMGDNMGSNIGLSSSPGQFSTSVALADSLALPDGDGVSYSTSLSVSTFQPGQVLNDINDLLSICVVMEHSWMHDLQIEMECPDGTSVVLQNQQQIGNEVFLGEPIDGDGFGGAPPAQGVGYEYCWTPNSTNGTWTEFSQLDDDGTVADYTLPPQDYASYEPLDNFVGCPLNGEWTITVTDLWQSDNGWIFEWGINLAPELYPNQESYDPGITDYFWEGNSTIFDYQGDSTDVRASPNYAGNLSYRLVSEDGFGCTFDTVLALQVLPFSHPDCYDCVENIAPIADTLICEGETVQLDAGNTEASTAEAPFVAEPRAYFEAVNHPPSNPFFSTIGVNSVNPPVLDDPLTQIESVCVNIETSWNSDLDLRLIAPDGQEMLLSNGNGGGSDNYTNTCFTPDAAQPITAGSGPFTGEFQPEGDWAALTGTTINGDWQLRATDAFGSPNDEGEFISWSITFASENEISYAWQGGGLSCTDCPNPLASPGTTTQYILTSNDSYGCVFQDTVQLGVVNDIAAPVVNCISNEETGVFFDWDAVGDFDQYEVNVIINGVPNGWEGPVNGTDYTVTDLNSGDEVALQVRVFTNGVQLNCDIAVGSSSCLYINCELALVENERSNVSCFNADDGRVDFSAGMGTPPYSFSLNGSTPKDNGVYENLAPGPYTIFVTDQEACADSISFDIIQPDSLSLNLQADAVVGCNGAADAVIHSEVTGGNGGFSYTWSDGEVGDTSVAENLTAGTYSLTVIDSLGCEAIDELTLNEPDSLLVSLQATLLSCAGQADGALEAIVNGGTPPYDYQWSDGQSSPTVEELPPGEYCLTVTDANGCTAVVCEELLEPATIWLDSITVQAVRCNGQSNGTLTVFASGGNGDFTYQWDDPLQQTGAQATMLSAQSYTVTISDQSGCTLVDTAVVTEPMPLSVNFELQPVNCNGGSDGQALSMPAGGTAPYSYEWENGQTEAEADNLAAGPYGLTITDANGCALESSVQIDEPEEPVSLLLTQTEQGCFGAGDNQVQAQASGGVGVFSYDWSNGQSNALGIGLDTIVYTVTATDDNGCTATANIEPEDLAPISFLIITNPPSCNGFDDGRLGINQISGGNGQVFEDYTINWSTGDNGPTADELAGGLTYSVTVTDGQGCSRVRERSLPDPAPITIRLTADSVGCFGGSDGQAAVAEVDGVLTPFSYAWDNGATMDSISGLNVGLYTVTVTDANDCVATASVEVEQPPALNATLEVTDNDCFGEQGGTIRVNPEGGSPGYTFAWSNGDLGREINKLEAGGYDLTLTDANGCEEIVEATVTEPMPILLSLTGEDPTCAGDTDGRIEAEAVGGTPPFRYSLDNEFFIANSTLIALSADSYRVYVQDNNGCVVSETITLNDPPPFTVDAGDERYTINLGDSIALEASVENAVGQVDFLWQAPYEGTLSCLACMRTTAQPEYSILYKLFAEDERGCRASDMVRVIVDKPRVVEVPTGFTPNGDRTNDRLLVHGQSPTVVNRFQVFDRWGELLYQARDFEVNDPDVGWDGSFRGKPADPGVYVWYLEVTYRDGQQAAFQGQTTLIR